MKVLLSILFAILLTNGFGQSIRHTETINEGWGFYQGNDVDPLETNPDITWKDVDLPHTWNKEDVLDDIKGYYRGVGWYKKTLKVPLVYENQKVFLYFEAANQVTTVYVNGIKAGPPHIGGYTPFAYDITMLVKEENDIIVQLDNSHNEEIIPLNADFNFYGGIYRDVYLIITKPVHFDVLDMGSNGVFITTPEVSEKSATVSIRSLLINPENENYFLKNTLLDADRNRIADAGQQKAQPGENFTRLIVEDPRLWSPDSPYLYTLVSEITDQMGNVLDRIENPVGFRWYRFDAKTGFYLNGKALKLIGTNRHQDFFESGNAVTNELHRYDMKLLKEMGINFLRISHYPQDPAILEMCNRYGFVATLEIPFVNKAAAGERGLANSVNMMREAIRSYFNNPCIVAWCTGNETTMSNVNEQGEAYLEHFQHTHKILADVVKEEDPSRYSYTVFFRSPEDHDELNIRQTEIVGHNMYVGWYGGKLENINTAIPELARRSIAIDPDKAFILSEYGAGSDPRIRSFAPARFDFSIEYQLLLHKEHLKVIKNTPEISGANVWNFADFQVESRIDAVPHVNNKGLVTLKREPKDAYYFYQAALRKDPVLTIPSKLWKNRSGIADAEDKSTCTQAVEIFSNLNNAELFLNGTSLGRQSFDFYASTWDVPFVNGKNQLEVCSTAGEKEIKDFLEIDFKVQPYHLNSRELPFDEIAVNVGSDCYFIEDHNINYLWLPDQEYREGSFGYIGGEKHMSKNSIGSKKSILLTKNDPVFQTQLIGLEAYKFDVPKGSFELTLCFAEVDTKVKNEMNILVNDEIVWPALNIREQFGEDRALTKRFLITVFDEKGIRIDFEALKGETRLSGIKLRKVY